MFVVIEGPDGCGKSTHAERLREKLQAKFFKFPNKNSATGKLIYENLEGLWYTTEPIGDQEVKPAREFPMTLGKTREALIFQALQILNRLESSEDIFKARGAGNVVVDRYWPSGYAYGKADGLNGDYLIEVHKALPAPDLCILLDIDIKDSVERRPERRDRYEANMSFMEKVMENYRELWARTIFPTSWVVVNARGSHEETAKLIDEAVVRYRYSNFGEV